MNSVRGWAAGLLMIPITCLKAPELRELDFSDDRLYLVLDSLGRDDEAWAAYEREQNATLIRVYDLKARQARIDGTMAKSYVVGEVSDGSADDPLYVPEIRKVQAGLG